MVEGMQARLVRRQFVEQLCTPQLPQSLRHIRRLQIGDTLQDRERNLSTDDGGTLKDLLGGFVEPIYTRGQDRLNGRWQRNRIDTAGEAVSPAPALEITALDQRVDQLLDKERIASRTFGDVAADQDERRVFAQQIA